MSTDHLYTTKASYDVMKSRAEARCAALEEEILRERESRKQAEDKGWNDALKAVGQEASKLCGWDLSSINRRLSKPVQEPAK